MAAESSPGSSRVHTASIEKCVVTDGRKLEQMLRTHPVYTTAVHHVLRTQASKPGHSILKHKRHSTEIYAPRHLSRSTCEAITPPLPSANSWIDQGDLLYTQGLLKLSTELLGKDGMKPPRSTVNLRNDRKSHASSKLISHRCDLARSQLQPVHCR